MNGTKYLLDTNVVIGLLKASPNTMELLKKYPDFLQYSAVSQITRMELLSFPGIDSHSVKQVSAFLDLCPVILLNEKIEQIAIKLRQSRQYKLPDAIIAATAILNKLRLLTLDEKLNKSFHKYQPDADKLSGL